jgi:hypothetical protein
MSNEQTNKALEIWTRLFETHDGSWSELAMKVIEEYTKPHNELAAAVVEAVPLLKHYENQMASALSCDDRTGEGLHIYRRQLNAILKASENLKPAGESANDKLTHGCPP